GSSISVVGGGQAQVSLPGRVGDYQQSVRDGRHGHQPKGVFSRAIRMRIEDTAALWSKPQLPGWDGGGGKTRARDRGPKMAAGPRPEESETKEEAKKPRRMKKVHLVVLTHGLHSNLGSDMLFLKESIDAGVKQAKTDAKTRRAKKRAAEGHAEPSPAVEDDDDDDDEEVLVRGFSGNATRTERGIKYLGKRLARYVLSMTYPDQPFLPISKAASDSVAQAFKGHGSKLDPDGKPSHKHSTIHGVASSEDDDERPYKVTKISFIGHSLGGLVQTYAIAYVQKHSPQFFHLIEPINFIAMASPFLGLNHENPLYVKAALDFGLVGRTGQDLGLTWRAPTVVRSGWGAIVSNLGE
ncbi:MAG: putative lipase, partial [Thaumarchaeota archaeon]|nr:putative lipase [Nitrososphaerota archaeon]